MRNLSKHLTFANVISCVALFVALSGAAYAATTLGKNAVKTRNIARGAVTAPKLRGAAVIAAKLAEDSVTRNKLAKNAVNSEKIAANSVTYAQLSSGSVGVGKILDGAVTESKVSTLLLGKIFKNLSYASKRSDSDTSPSKSVFAECPSGKQAIGGGGQVVGSTTGVALVKSVPNLGVTNEATSWSVTATAIAPEGNPWAVEASVVCAEL